MSAGHWMFLGWLTLSIGYAEELPLVCSPAEAVAESGETVQLTAWAPGPGFEYHWSTSAGRIEGDGSQVKWSLGEQEPGVKMANVEATREGQGTLRCGVQVFVQSLVVTRGGKARRYLLGPRVPEPKGYGLYSYLLLTPGGGDKEAEERNKNCVDAYRARILTASKLESSLDRALLNATYAPVVAVSQEEDPPAEWIFKNYDYRRAGALLQKIAGVHLRGPYLVSTAQPLSRYMGGPLLCFDLSWAPPRTVRFWVEEFMAQGEQERWDQPRKMAMLELKLRTLISVAAGGVPMTREGMAAVLTLLR